jgi:hypothetical protein
MDFIRFVQTVIKNKSDFQRIVEKCEDIQELIETEISGVSEKYLRGSLGRAISRLNK